MLASTVQFSNNDQPPVTTRRSRSLPGPATEGSSFPQTPNSVPDQNPSGDHAFHAPKSSTSSLRPRLRPSSQRSTHEQPARVVRSRSGL
jgi:hypothetical protein